MALTCTLIGQNGTSASVGSQTLSAYNQTAGNTIVVLSYVYNGGASIHASSITDTAGNSFTSIFAGNGIVVNTIFAQVWYKTSCLGNASNVVTVNYSAATTYSGLVAYDLGGVSALDISTSATASVPSNTNQNVTVGAFSTTAANEVILVFGAANAPGSFAWGNFDGTYTFDCHSSTIGALGLPTLDLWAGAHKIVSSTQVGITPGLQAQNGVSGAAPTGVLVTTFKSAAAATTKQSIVNILG